MNRTELNDLAPIGDELDESALHGISGGRPRILVIEVGGTQIDPPGVCVED
ncbi:hypothetical protein [Planobispora takensis]|uniref:Uncharacterized protein n=1 Tax=Planobispora takensis TaxID=1367882 RepID=A0A8J3SZB2_9ACTN|nr:hypothetical protein [Planobispora takensis]GII03227.1 hypothetical protein Pta02_52350 [Planobispora takensis]